MAAYKSRTGFTIVELLIVIVVIAILAAISIVAYSGVQERGQNSQIEQAASQTLKLLQAYTAASGVNLSVSGCLVPVAGEANCLWGGSSYPAGSSSAITTLSATGRPPSSVPAFKETNYAGIFYSYSTSRQVGGVDAPGILVYTLRGVKTCSVGRIVNGGGYALQPSTTGRTLTTSDGNTLCIASVPTP